MNTQIVKAGKAGRKRYLESERRELMRKFGASGMTQAAFCRANGLNAVTLSKWLRVRGVKSGVRGPARSAQASLFRPHSGGEKKARPFRSQESERRQAARGGETGSETSRGEGRKTEIRASVLPRSG